MIVKELISVVYDEVIIYKEKNDNFEDIYKGDKYNIPSNILEMKVKIVGAKRKGIVDIQVF